MSSAYANGEKAIPATGSAVLARDLVRYKIPAPLNLLILNPLLQISLKVRYKISAAIKPLSSWDLSPSWWVHRYKRTSRVTSGA